MTVLTSDVGVTDIAAHEERRARILAALAEKPDGVLEAIARDDQADKITPEMLEEYVSRAVVARTNDRQHPKRFQAIETIRLSMAGHRTRLPFRPPWISIG